MLYIYRKYLSISPYCSSVMLIYEKYNIPNANIYLERIPNTLMKQLYLSNIIFFVNILNGKTNVHILPLSNIRSLWVLTVSPDGADKVGMHVLIHHHSVTSGKVAAEEIRAVWNGLSAEMTLQVVLHFWKSLNSLQQDIYIPTAWSRFYILFIARNILLSHSWGETEEIDGYQNQITYVL